MTIAAASAAVSKEVTWSVLSIVTNVPGIALAQLLQEAKKASVDDIHSLIAAKQVYINLSAAPLTEPFQVRVFPSASAQE